MMDLETRGNIAGCQVVSIGIIAMNLSAETPDAVFSDGGYYAVVNKSCCDEAMLHIDDSTMDWWGRQSGEARKALIQSNADEGTPLVEALTQMVGYVAEHCTPRNAKVWGNGADFDNPIINVAARMVLPQLPWYKPGVDQSPLPWQWGNRCYRTAKNLHELLGADGLAPKLQRSGTYHNALDDAKTQALHLWEIAHTLRGRIDNG